MLAEWTNSMGISDFRYMREDLYRKKTGEYFLYGEGGPMTQYAKQEGSNCWGYGECIMPLTYQEATAWAEEHLDGDTYESIFGEIVEDETQIMTSIRLKASTLEKLKRKAQEQGKGFSETLESILAEVLD